MNSYDDYKVESVRLATPDDEEVQSWGAQGVKNSLKALHEALKQMLTLTTALLAGSAAFFVHLPAANPAKAVMAVLLLVSMTCAMAGWLPRGAEYDLCRLDQMRAVRESLKAWKVWWLRGSCLSLWLAFVVLLCGLRL